MDLSGYTIEQLIELEKNVAEAIETKKKTTVKLKTIAAKRMQNDLLDAARKAGISQKDFEAAFG